MVKTVLELDFLDESDKSFKLRVSDPREDLEEIEISSAMDTIISKNIFISNDRDLLEKNSARVITTSIESMVF